MKLTKARKRSIIGLNEGTSPHYENGADCAKESTMSFFVEMVTRTLTTMNTSPEVFQKDFGAFLEFGGLWCLLVVVYACLSFAGERLTDSPSSSEVEQAAIAIGIGLPGFVLAIVLLVSTWYLGLCSLFHLFRALS